ncbi:MAG TPA: N-acetylneuraminate synthase [Puia sp.]|nr:N-acetylneuraminate synthase [Puia sp.]
MEINKVIIIAEAGVNHNGSIKLAKKLIDEAASAGVDIVKFQTFKAEKIASKYSQKASYQIANTGNDESQYEMLKRLELNYEDHIELIKYCTSKNIEFLSTPFDLESIDLLKELGIKKGKIPSGEITNLPYLRKMAATFDELILSTGMSTLEEIKDAIGVLVSAGMAKANITVLHCNTEYPTPFEDVNLLAMQTIGKSFDVRTGYSDHTPGIEVPIAAVALGAVLIEKHFTLDRNMEGPDHKASLEPGELKKMVESIRHIEKALGSSIKSPSPSEIKNKIVARKSLVAAAEIKSGEVFTEKNLTVKRPGNGISPMEWDNVIGKKAKHHFKEDELIEL